MLMQPIEPDLDWRAHVAVRLLRRWAALRLSGEAQLPGLVGLATELGICSATAVAFGSVFQLTEACLERPLEAECCCSLDLSSDEHAILHMLRSAPSRGAPLASHSIPHGLPGALAWALASAKRLSIPPEAGDYGAVLRRCPFSKTALSD